MVARRSRVVALSVPVPVLAPTGLGQLIPAAIAAATRILANLGA
ncbi:hypothetical protein [Phytomonospora endophytica]|uniref:Uncharacterized protein n=1 Tax=Phytomonospora endophytica TaxID=714109 RepID=A0A841FPW4_9ACTN|nr:hypothetical protein [Phytomonospora endophytica]MBB6039341.1 hypothetical protein [Phytomonospora endophytica]